MIAYTNEARESIRQSALESIRTLATLRPSDDGMTLEQIRQAMQNLRRLADECEREIRVENRKTMQSRREQIYR